MKFPERTTPDDQIPQGGRRRDRRHAGARRLRRQRDGGGSDRHAGGSGSGTDADVTPRSPRAATSRCGPGTARSRRSVAASRRSTRTSRSTWSTPGTGNNQYTALQNAIAAGKGVPDVAQIEYYALPQFALPSRSPT
jgi:hypothetical protein